MCCLFSETTVALTVFVLLVNVFWTTLYITTLRRIDTVLHDTLFGVDPLRVSVPFSDRSATFMTDAVEPVNPLVHNCRRQIIRAKLT